MPRRNILYKRVYHSLCTRIFSGQLCTGDKLPPMLELADEFRVSIITIRSTFKLLQELGLIRVSRGKEAVVIYDKDKPSSRAKLAQWVKNREAVILDVFTMMENLLPQTLAFGGSLARAEDVEKLAIIVQHAEEDPGDPGTLSLGLMEFYGVLVQLTHNETFASLLLASDAYMSMTMVAAAQSGEYRADYCAAALDYLGTMLAALRSGSAAQLASIARANIGRIRERTANYMAAITKGFTPNENIFLEWSMFRELSLHSEIANDLILRISAGEFFDGDHLPSEQKLQQQYNTSSKTIRRAILALNDYGIVRTINGIGTIMTYLSLDEPAGEEEFSAGTEFTEYFSALQLIILNAGGIAQQGLPPLTDVQAETARARVGRLLESPNHEFYSYVGILLQTAIQNYSHSLTRGILQQLNTCLFLSCHRRKYASDLFRDVQAQALPYVQDALSRLDSRDTAGFSEDILIMMKTLFSASEEMCGYYHKPIDVPMPL